MASPELRRPLFAILFKEKYLYLTGFWGFGVLGFWGFIQDFRD